MIFRWFSAKTWKWPFFEIFQSHVKNDFGLNFFSKSLNNIVLLIPNPLNHICMISWNKRRVGLTGRIGNHCLATIFQEIQNGAKDSVRIFSSEYHFIIIIGHHRNRQECIRAVSSTLGHSSMQWWNHVFGELLFKINWSTFKALQPSETISKVPTFFSYSFLTMWNMYCNPFFSFSTYLKIIFRDFADMTVIQQNESKSRIFKSL